MKHTHRPSRDIPPSLPPNLEFIFNLSPSVFTLGLGNIRALLRRLGHPQRRFPAIIVAGTNGKGSVTTYIASILARQGLKVGRYTSPHVYSVTERIWVDGESIALDHMEALAARVVPLYEETPFSYFEAITAIAFLEFAERGVDYAVLEVGLGGRFDATNVAEPVLTVLTNVTLDHRRILGDTEEEILREKLGITRPGIPLLTGDLAAGLRPQLETASRRRGFPLIGLEDIGRAELVEMSLSAMRVNLATRRRNYGEVRLPFRGFGQVANSLLALGAAERVLDRIDNLAAGFASAYLPGRFEIINRGGRTVILDVAHNDAALIPLARTFAAMSPPADNLLVFGMLSRKELDHCLDPMLSAADRIFLAQPEGGEAYSAEELLSIIAKRPAASTRREILAWPDDDLPATWDRLVESVLDPAAPFSCVLVTGSHRTVESFGQRLNKERRA
jgi:dihydrofolate synthase/folylpolyglutamate synthase